MSAGHGGYPLEQNIPQLIACIPARMASKRFPGKPLLSLGNIPMVIRVAHNVARLLPKQDIVICSADPEILQVAQDYGYQAFATQACDQSGTDRIAQAAAHFPAQSYLNVQGDMAVFDRQDLQALLKMAQSPSWEMVTLAQPIQDRETYLNPNVVKVVCDAHGKALYFSRSPIPHHPQSSSFPQGALAHVGIYWFTAGALQRFVQAPQSDLEQTEQLEQLRALDLGFRLGVCRARHVCMSVDTPQDGHNVQAWLEQQSPWQPCQQPSTATTTQHNI